ncbi:MAG: UDP-N-acetyl-D-galactosamine dehydrogenase [Flavobacteriales bacterium]|jgi:UDP-N-acetyl-D-galactosamine dehydrogenase
MQDTIAIIGLGYVGLPLAVEFGKKTPTIGFDVNLKRIEELRNGIDGTLEVESEELKSIKHLTYSADLTDLVKATIFIVTVPTPIDKNRRPDLRPLLAASQSIGKALKVGDIVIYESTVYPGCTEEDCVPVLEEYSGLKFNTDFFCGYSPERINPGDKKHRLPDIKKVTSGSTPEIAERVDQLYKSIITAGTHKAPSIKVAEAAKVIENCQRDVNISFVNELALIFDRMHIDTGEVLEAARTKWNFLNFRPGLVGGHCIGVDPYYLTHKSDELGYTPQVILSGRSVNDNMGIFVANKVVKLLIQKNHAVKGTRTLLLGITFKENCPDIRNSKAIDIIRELNQFGIEVDVHDPWANAEEVKAEYGLDLIEPTIKYDAVIMAVNHTQFETLNIKDLIKENSVVFDVKGVLDPKMVDARL